jgi:predicted MFS family arabinose efflux permease
MSNPPASPPPANPAAGAPAVFTPYEKFIVAILAFLQFTVVLDFMIMSPLGALLMRDLHVPAARFGLVVSIYAFSAGGAGLLAAGFADRFDRKRLLLFFYSGFVLGTLLCGVAPNYPFLLLARMVTGLFGGVLGSISFAIIADLFPMQVRGRVMGTVQTAFAASQVMGIPLGVYLSNRWGWHAPFLLIVAVSSLVGLVIATKMRPIDAHLRLQKPADHDPLRHLFRTVSRPDYLRAFAATTLLVTGGFMLMPFGSAFTVHNLGIGFERLPLIYMVTGVCSFLAGPLIGRLSDRVGKYVLFCAGSVLAIVMVLIYTHLGVTPLPLVILCNVLLFLGITSRMISAAALMSAVPEPQNRGAFMAVNNSVQQVAGGIASAAGGLVVIVAPGGNLLHYDVLGYVVVVAMLIAMALLYVVHRAVAAKSGGQPLPAQVLVGSAR